MTSASASVLATSSTENRTPRTDGTTIDDTRKIDRKGGSCGPTGETSGPLPRVRSSCDGTSACLAALRLAPRPVHPKPLGSLSTNLRRTASQPSQPSRAHLVASLSLVPPLVLSCALPAEIRRRRPPRCGTAAPHAAGARAGGAIRHVLAPRRAAARIPRPCPGRSLPDRRSGRRSSSSGCPGRWPGSSLRSPLPAHRSALARIWIPAKTYVAGAACGASRALCVRILTALPWMCMCEHVCPPCALTRTYRHHTRSRRVLCEIIR